MALLAENIGQMIMVGFVGHSPPPHVLEWLASGQIGGVYLFGRNARMETAQLALAQVICGRARSNLDLRAQSL